MGVCAGNSYMKDLGDRFKDIDIKFQHKSEGFSKLEATIQSHTRGLKTQIKESMDERELYGTIKKVSIEPGVDTDTRPVPIQTEIVAQGDADDVADFAELLKEIVEEDIEVETKITAIEQLVPKEEQKIIMEQTSEKIATRKGSDAGEESGESDPEADMVKKAKAQMREKAKQMISAVSNIPFLAEYADQVIGKWSLKTAEEPKELITATSLSHPVIVFSFPFYPGDGPSVLKTCIEWKLKIPFDDIELFTVLGNPLTDIDTLQNEKNCWFVDKRITERFFSSGDDAKLKNLVEKITTDAIVLHKMALNGMNAKFFKEILETINEQTAVRLIKEDLDISGIIALRIISLVKGGQL